MKLGIGIVTAGGYANYLPSAFFWSLYALHSEILQGKLNVYLPKEKQITANTLIRSGKFPTDAARNEICQQALDQGVDTLLFLDADHTFEPKAVERLLSHPYDVVSGRYHVKSPPFQPTLYLTPKTAHAPGNYQSIHYGQGVFPVDRCGAGALAISRTALEKVGYPWFRYGADPKPPHDLSVSEDFYFCERVQAEGMQIWADWDATFDHVAVLPVTEYHRRAYLDEMEQAIGAGKTELLESIVACGFPEGHALPSGHVVPSYEATPAGVS